MCIGMANGVKIPKMTDKDIIKALECCVIDDYDESCTKCPMLKHKPCDYTLHKNALDLINRQQKQLDNYSHKVRTMAKDICRYKANIDRLKDKNLELLHKLSPYEEYPPLENIIVEKESDTE